MQTEQLLQLCRFPQPPPLAAWLAEPLSAEQAEACLALIRGMSRERCRDGGTSFNRRMVQMIARYWLDQDAEMDYRNLAATVEKVQDRARLELGYGQLLMARKMETAWEHLNTGFAVAAHLLQAEEYFVVLQRHEKLRLLPLSPAAGPGIGLDSLLKEAGVIRRLQGKMSNRKLMGSQHRDTVD